MISNEEWERINKVLDDLSKEEGRMLDAQFLAKIIERLSTKVIQQQDAINKLTNN